MSKGKKTGGRDFKSGEEWTGNYKGRLPLSEELAALTIDRTMVKDIHQHDFAQIIREIRDKPVAELRLMVKDGNLPSFKALICSAYASAMSGSSRHMDLLLERLLGPVPKPVEISGPDGEPVPLAVALSQDELTEAVTLVQCLIRGEVVSEVEPMAVLPPSKDLK